MRRRNGRSAAFGSAVRSVPSYVMRPSVGSSSRIACARACSCRIRSRPRARGLATRHLEVDSIDRAHRGERAPEERALRDERLADALQRERGVDSLTDAPCSSDARMHATVRSPKRSAAGHVGATIDRANSQRSRNLHRRGRVAQIGHEAADRGQAWLRRVVAEAPARSRAARVCTGAAVFSKSASFGAVSTTRPAYITATSSATSATTAEIVRDEHHARAELRVAGRRSARGSAPGSSTSSAVVGLVGQQHTRLARDRRRDHHALTHAARELVR